MPTATVPSLASPPAVLPPSPTNPPTATALTGRQNLTGKAPSDIPGILLASSAIVSSVVDEHTKARDVYAISLAAGQTLQIQVDVSGTVTYGVQIANPDARTFQAGGWTGQTPCNYAFASCSATFAPAVGGTYYVAIVAQSPTVSYTLHVTTH
jgi:hypothetical protein